MSSPLKLASSLLSKKIKSPVTPKFLSPCCNKHDEIRKSLLFCDNTRNFLEDCGENITNNIEIKIPERLKDGFTINSPNKLNLLKHGLNKQSLLYTIGKGTFGTVIKGKYHGNLVAVKIIKLDKVSEKIRECNAQHLIHDNIIRIVNIICNSTEKYGLILMEYCENSRNLQQILDDHSFALDKNSVVKMSRDITRGLKYCHENGILHLDLKPKNILLCNNQCKICDFGNSVKESEAIPIYHYKGTVAYTAPEILKGEKPTVKSDIYSLGILFWQMVSRKLPYEPMDNEVVIYKVVKFNLRPNISAMKNMENFLKLCILCWKENPNNRPLSSDVLVALMWLQ